MFLTPATDPMLGYQFFTLLVAFCVGVGISGLNISGLSRSFKGALKRNFDTLTEIAGGKSTANLEPNPKKWPLFIRSLVCAGLVFAGIGASLLGYQSVSMGFVIFGGVGFPIPFLRLVTA